MEDDSTRFPVSQLTLGMNPKSESPRFVLILGGLFLIAYAAFWAGSAWMDSVAADQAASLETPTLTPTPGISQTPTISPTSLPLYWITPTNFHWTPTAEQQNTSTPGSEMPTVSQTGIPATPENTLAPPTQEPTEFAPTISPMVTPIASPTSDSYPGPEPTNDPYPGPIPTYDPYPGPGGTSTPLPTFTATDSGNPGQPSPTLMPSLTPQPTDSAITPTPVATNALQTPTSTSPPLTTIPYTETLIISNGVVNQVIWSQDALTLTLATSYGLYLVDADTLHREQILDKGASVLSAAYAFNDGLIATGGGDAVIRWWDPENNKYLGDLQGHRLGVVRLGLPIFGSFLASGSDDAAIRVWDISTMYNLGVDGVRLLFVFYEPQNRVTDLAVSGIGEMVAASSNQFVHIWNPFSGELLKTIHQPTGWYTALALSPDSLTLATAFDGRRLEFWNTHTWARSKFLPLDGAVQVLSFSSDGNLFAVGYEDGRIKIWNARTYQLLADLSGHKGLTSMAFSPAGDQLATTSDNGTIRIWDVTLRETPEGD